MVNTRVQIIIPVYNSGKYLRRCLDSLKAQTYDSWQAIIIDDASTDESVDILRDYSETDERFTVFRQEKTGGVAKARNLGLSKLSAEYTAFLDSDDFWEKDMLEVMLDKAEENSADIVQCRFIYDFEDNKTVLPKGTFSKVAMPSRLVRAVMMATPLEAIRLNSTPASGFSDSSSFSMEKRV